MEFTGVVGPDAPDPAEERRVRVAALGIPIAGFVPQHHLEDLGDIGLAASYRGGAQDPGSLVRAEVGRSYLLWRNPADRADPANLAELDDEARSALDEQPDVPLPAWLQRARERMRRPMLWEAVRTSWVAPGGRDSIDLTTCLIGHAEYLLHNRFREELSLEWPERRDLIPEAAVQEARVVVDGEPCDGMRIDADPFVFAIGAVLAPDRVVTAVVPRNDLPLVRLELLSDAPLIPVL